MKLPDIRVIVFNVAAGVITVAALVALVRSLMLTPAVAPCTERYPAGTIFSLERGGALLTHHELQSRLGGKDVGLGDNVVIARGKGGAWPVAMGITLSKGSASPHAPGHATKGGLSFPWEPRAVQGKASACLAYGVLLPADFDFHRGGVLPGIRGLDDSASTSDGFTEAIAWQSGGRGGVTSKVVQGGQTRIGRAEPEPFVLPGGRWVKVEQEVVLNAPGQSDGILRVWIDGSLAIERTDMLFRTNPKVAVSGVAADVFYGTEDAATAAPKDATIWLSPFELRWQ